FLHLPRAPLYGLFGDVLQIPIHEGVFPLFAGLLDPWLDLTPHGQMLAIGGIEEFFVEHPLLYQSASNIPLRPHHADVVILLLPGEVAVPDLLPGGWIEFEQEPMSRFAQLFLAADLVQAEKQIGIVIGGLHHKSVPPHGLLKPGPASVARTAMNLACHGISAPGPVSRPGLIYT